MSLFGQSTGVVEEIHIKSTRNAVSRKEILNWERELIGLYITDHPLNPIMSELVDVVTHYSGQLAEAGHEEHVRLVGIITRIRNHQTKSGKSMAFVAMEDLQGTVDLVIFPRTWERVAELVKPDQIVLVEGKVDASSGEPKVLVDNVAKEFSKMSGNEKKTLQPAKTIVSNQSATLGGNNPPKKPDFPAGEEDPIVDWEGMPPQPDEPPDWYALEPAIAAEPPSQVRIEDLPELTVQILATEAAEKTLPELDSLAIHAVEMESQVVIPGVAPDGHPGGSSPKTARNPTPGSQACWCRWG